MAATDLLTPPLGRGRRITPLGWMGRAVAFLLGFAVVVWADLGHGAILPEDRSDVMYHGYEGGGLRVEGPSVLVRKAYKDKFSVWGNYYVDMISSASIDVVTTASPYTEERTEYSIGADYLHDKTTMGASFTLPFTTTRASFSPVLFWAALRRSR